MKIRLRYKFTIAGILFLAPIIYGAYFNDTTIKTVPFPKPDKSKGTCIGYDYNIHQYRYISNEPITAPSESDKESAAQELIKLQSKSKKNNGWNRATKKDLEEFDMDNIEDAHEFSKDY